MAASFRKIDYSLRPAKHAERRMILDVFRGLRPFQPVEDYIYLGFGSVWFSDFILFHRALAIKDMISIEKTLTAEPRIEANKPFANIKMHYDKSFEVLPKLHWDKRHFLWLDYDDPLTTDMLLDVRTVIGRACSGSVLAITVQSQQAEQVAQALEEEGSPSAINRFRDLFGRDRVPSTVTEAQLYGWPFAKLSRNLIYQEIDTSLAVRNSNGETATAFQFRRICDFEYEDGAKMTTIVGILFTPAEQILVEACRFDKLDFIRDSSRPVRIEIPKMTVRELRSIERQLPADPAGLICGSIPSKEVRAFAELYRYLPNFAVLEN